MDDKLRSSLIELYHWRLFPWRDSDPDCLYETISQADKILREELAKVFPMQVAAFLLYKSKKCSDAEFFRDCLGIDFVFKGEPDGV